MDSALLHTILPELILAVGALTLLMIGVFTSNGERAGRLIGWLAIGVFVAAIIAIFQQSGVASVFENAFVSDPLTRFFKIVILVAAVLSLLMTFDDFGRIKLMLFEYPVLMLLAALGMLMMVSANDLIALYLGLELQNLALYVIAAFKRDSVRSSEAGLKYFVLSALASGLLLYGASLLYGVTGSTGYVEIAAASRVPEMASNIGLTVGLVFVLVGLAFKIASVPFHMWTPDVYQGAPTPVTVFLASASKVAAMALIVRFTQAALPGIAAEWQQIVIFLAIASMVLGAFAAIGQTNIKRLLAYSAIGHVGFALIGLAANNTEGTAGVLIYLAIYVAMTLGSFACVLAMRRKGGNVESISDLAGLAKTDLTYATILAILMFSLAGIPPLAGFWAKWYVFLAAIKAGLYPLAVIGVVTSVVGAFYYLRIVKIMFFDDSGEAFLQRERKTSVVMALSAAFVVLFVLPFIGDTLVEAAHAAAAVLAPAQVL
ncbi:MAG TPA: NADH-quinone oxidoreductase subunit NuoN [Hyphomicrobium sp.]|jgi:NADH-quinone oxidoreductase subunit N|nr:NADH-quinone oxidoreductase subunit NuoN [Hyphomicrobium sp.]